MAAEAAIRSAGWPTDPAQIPADLQLFTVDEAAAILRCKPSWLRERARCRKVPFTMLGGAYRFTGRHLGDIIRQFEITPGAEQRPASAPRRRTRETTASVPAVTPLRARPPQRRRSA